MERVVATSRKAMRSKLRCTTSKDESQEGFGRCDTLSFSTFCPVVLDGILVNVDEGVTFDSFTENESVVLIHTEDSLNPYLNLSPFIVDENALSGQQNSKVFFYRYGAEGNYYFQLTDNLKDMLIVDDDHYPEVKTLLEDFRRLML